jgi:hypothetical protein
VASLREFDAERLTREFITLTPRVVAVAVVFGVLSGGAAAEPPRLAPGQVAEVLAERARGCAWEPLTTSPSPPRARIERWRALDCAAAGVWNLLVEPDADRRVAVTVLLPGATRQPPAVQGPAALAVLARAGDDGCRERRVVDTSVIATSPAGGVERWTVVACGERLAYRVAFTARDDEAPGIAVTPLGDAAAAPAVSR